jgi:DNA polymerase I
MSRLIYGKNDFQRIVSIEVQDGKATLFQEMPSGEVVTTTVPNRFWILASECPDNTGWKRLKGDLHYKWGKQYTNREFYQKERYRYGLNRDCFSIYNAKEALMVKDGYTYYKGMKHDEVSVMSFDLETTGLYHNDESDVLIIATTFRKHGKITRRMFCYDDFPDRRTMLDAFCAYVRESNPSVLLGHNILTYDFPYLAYVAKKVGCRLLLGRDGSEIKFDQYESEYRKDATQFYHYHKVHIFGREVVDTLFGAIRYDAPLKKYESYALKAIIATEGKEVPGRQHYDAGKIRTNYKIPEEWAKIKRYAMHDGDDALTVYDFTTPPFFYLAQSIPKPYQLILESASGSQINSVMIRSYLQEGHSLPKASPAAEYQGAISFGNPGVYRNVFKVDVGSLYPNVMLEYKVYDPEKDPLGNFLNLVSTFTERRLKHKKLAKTDQYYDDLQNAEKIFINSCYGFLGAPGLLFNAPGRASFVTEKGRDILSEAIRWAESRSMVIVNADTDSISFCDKQNREFSPEERRQLLNDLNSLFPERIKFEDDGFFPVVIVVKAKNYVLFDGKKLKYKGSALKATTKEPALQNFIKETIEAIVNTDQPDIQLQTDLTQIYHKFVHEILNITDIRRWVTRKTITDKVINAERTNEQKVKDAIAESEYVEGDRAYFFFKPDGTLCLMENFDGNYDQNKLLEKLYKTAEVFDTILDVKSLFPNYKLKRNKPKLDNLSFL